LESEATGMKRRGAHARVSRGVNSIAPLRAGKSKCPFIYPGAGARCKIDSAGIINNNVPGEIDFWNNAFLNFDQ